MEMIDHGDVRLETDQMTLMALTDSIDGIRIDDSPGDSGGHAVWIKLHNRGLVQIKTISVGLAFQFEVFPLFVGGMEAWRAYMAPILPAVEAELEKSGSDLPQSQDEMISLVPFEPLPAGSWTLEILQRRDWIASPDKMDAEHLEGRASLRAGEVPKGTVQSCLVAVELLFTFGDGSRLLVASADWPPDTLITMRDAERINSFLSPCFRVEAGRYARMLPA